MEELIDKIYDKFINHYKDGHKGFNLDDILHLLVSEEEADSLTKMSTIMCIRSKGNPGVAMGHIAEYIKQKGSVEYKLAGIPIILRVLEYLNSSSNRAQNAKAYLTYVSICRANDVDHLDPSIEDIDRLVDITIGHEPKKEEKVEEVKEDRGDQDDFLFI